MSFARHGWTGLLAIALLGACGKGDGGGSAAAAVQSAENFCVQAVGAKCSALGGCCQNGTQFDPFECKRSELEACLGMVGVAKVHGGELKFDPAAAKACIGATSCPTPGTTAAPDPVTTIACNNVLTGYSPLGAGCLSDSECAAPGGGSYPKCFQPGPGDGVCAKAIFSTDGTCGFFADALELRVCPNGGTCTIPPNAIPPNAEGKARFDLHGTCTPLAQAGQPCGVLDGGATIDCAPGLTCQSLNGSQPVCTQPKTQGQQCAQSNECATYLWCNPQTHACEQQPGVSVGDGQYCYHSGVGGGAGAGGAGGSGGFGGAGGACQVNGGSCAYSSDCCSGSCQEGYCSPSSCLNDGNYCSSASQCCSGQCSNGICGAPSCGQTGSYCTSSSQCCSGLTCNNYACGTTPSCGSSGSYCSYASDCCSGLLCNGYTGQCATCGSSGYSCAADGDCCSGLTCNNYVCGTTPTCKQSGQTCSYTSDCCSGLTCSSGYCTTCGATGTYCYYNSDCCSNSCNTSTYTCN